MRGRDYHGEKVMPSNFNLVEDVDNNTASTIQCAMGCGENLVLPRLSLMPTGEVSKKLLEKITLSLK